VCLFVSVCKHYTTVRRPHCGVCVGVCVCVCICVSVCGAFTYMMCAFMHACTYMLACMRNGRLVSCMCACILESN